MPEEIYQLSNEQMNRALERARQMHAAFAAFKRAAKPWHFKFITLETAVPLYHCNQVLVIGHPDDGSYEWVVRHANEFEDDPDVRYEHSDMGYGGTDVAMHDGMLRAYEDPHLAEYFNHYPNGSIRESFVSSSTHSTSRRSDRLPTA